MICKECGAYNPDHATYCKVCAASLKEETETTSSSDAASEARPTRTFVRPSWTVPAYIKSTPSKPTDNEPAVSFKRPEKEPEVEAPQEDRLFEENTDSESIPELSFKPADEDEEMIPEASEEPESEPNGAPEFEDYDSSDEDEEDEFEEPAPVYHRSKRIKHAPIHLDDEEENENEDSDVSSDSYEDETGDDSYEYEPTPPKRKKKSNGNGPLFWILLAAIILVILCIIVAGVLMFMSSGGNKLSCGGNQQTNPKTQQTEQLPTLSDNPADDTTSQNAVASQYDVELVEGFTNDGQEGVDLNIVVPAHGVVTVVLPNRGSQDYPSNFDTPVVFKLTVPKSAYYPDVPLTESVYEVHPEIYLTESDGTRKQLTVPSFTLNFPSLTIDLEKPILDENGHVMANKDNIVPISGHVNEDLDVKLYMNDEQVIVYSEGLFMPDYNMTSTESATVKLRAEKNNFVSTSLEFTVDPYVYTPEKMILNVTSDRITELKADKTGKITVRGNTLPNATLSASSDTPSRVVCGSVSVDGEGNFTFGITVDPSFYGIAHITVDAEKEEAERGSTTFMIYRTYADKTAFISGYNKTKTYKEVGAAKKYLSIATLMANISTYANADYGLRITAKVVDVTQTEEGYSVVRMTLAGSGETVYVINLSEKWSPESNIGKSYNLYGNFLGVYTDGTSPYFCAFFAMNK